MGEPLTIFRAIGELIARYQAEGMQQQEHPSLAVVAALLGPLMYTAMMRNSIQEEFLPQIDLGKHVSLFLEGRNKI